MGPAFDHSELQKMSVIQWNTCITLFCGFS